MSDFSVVKHDDGRLEAIDPPPVGAFSAFSLELLAKLDHRCAVTGDGLLLLAGLEFAPRRFGNVDSHRFGPPQLLICERVA